LKLNNEMEGVNLIFRNTFLFSYSGVNQMQNLPQDLWADILHAAPPSGLQSGSQMMEEYLQTHQLIVRCSVPFAAGFIHSNNMCK